MGVPGVYGVSGGSRAEAGSVAGAQEERALTSN